MTMQAWSPDPGGANYGLFRVYALPFGAIGISIICPGIIKKQERASFKDPLSCFILHHISQSPCYTLSRFLSLIHIRHKLQRTVLRCPPVVTVVSIHFILLRKSH